MKKKLTIAVIPGDGVGPEVIPHAQKVLEKVCKRLNVPLRFESFPFSANEYLKTKRTLTRDDLHRFKNEFDAILFGALGDPRIPDNIHAKEILLGLRFKLDLFVNFRPVRLLEDRLSSLKGKSAKDIQFVIFRENTEDLYQNMGGVFQKGEEREVAIETMINSATGVTRILEAACAYAQANRLDKVCMVDKSNLLRFGHELWQRKWKEIQPKFSKLSFQHLYVDAAAMEMIRAPEQFQVIVTSNLFGDILSDLGAQLQGGMGMAASLNYRPFGPVLAEPVHGSAPNIAGKGIANPVATVLTVGLLLEHFGFSDEAKKIEEAVRASVRENVMTPDIGGKSKTAEVGDFIYERI